MNTSICQLQAKVGHLKQLLSLARTLAFGPGAAGQGRAPRRRAAMYQVSGAKPPVGQAEH